MKIRNFENYFNKTKKKNCENMSTKKENGHIWMAHQKYVLLFSPAIISISRDRSSSSFIKFK